MAKQQRLNPKRPFEKIVGTNRSVIRYKLGNVHAANSLWHALHMARPKDMRSMPVALRRGWVKCVIEEWKSIQKVYHNVLTGSF